MSKLMMGQGAGEQPQVPLDSKMAGVQVQEGNPLQAVANGTI